MNKVSFAGFFLLLFANSTLAQTETLLDYRTEDFNFESSPQLSATTENVVISQVVRSTDKACFDNLSPTVIDYAIGSFTDPQEDQVVYLVDLGDSCHHGYTGTIRIAVASSGKVVTYGDVTGYSTIQQITDVNGDGINEIILERNWAEQGYSGTYAKLVEIKPKGLLTLNDFEKVYEDNLSSINPNLYKIASVISVNQGSQGQTVFTRKNYIARCFEVDFEERECSSYEYMSEGKFLEYEDIERFISNPAKESKQDAGVYHDSTDYAR